MSEINVGSSQGEKRKWFDFNRIKDKLVLIVIVIIGILSLITMVVSFQNIRTRAVLDNISALRIPVPIVTADILSGANRVSASQRAYMMTGDDKYKEERLQVWREQIKPAATKLNDLKEIMKVPEHREIVDKTIEQLNYYEKLQEEIDIFFERELKDFDLSLVGSDSSSLANLANRVEAKNRLDQELDTLVAGEASRARKVLRAIITPLNQAQEELLMNDNITVNGRIASSTRLMLITSIIGVVLIVVFAVLLFKSLTKSIQRPTELLIAMSEGKISDQENYSKDELNDIFQATNLLSANMITASNFALNIGEGNFDYSFEPAGEDDQLGNSLVQMRDKLQVVAADDKKRSWVSEGLAKFADILRGDASDIKEFGSTIISELVKYTSANQGSIFVVNSEDEEEFLNLVGCYAWDRRKFIDKKIGRGEGLIGQAWLEEENIYLEEMPEDFIQIKSGLGGANPNAVLITPIKTDNTIEGIIELAFFHRLEPYHIDFIEKLCANIAATMSSVKINQKTQNLLEQSQQQSEELRAQEEEMRQNMEELTATQEEMSRKDVERMGQLNAINNSMATIEFDVEGNIITANTKFLGVMGYSLDEVQGKHHRIFVDQNYASSEDYEKFWQALKNGVSQVGEVKRFSKNGREVWLNASYTPVLDKANRTQKIIKFSSDITVEKLKSIEFEGQMRAINKTLASIEFELDGTIITANSAFLDAMGYSLSEIKGKHHRIFVDTVFGNSVEYQQFWLELGRGRHQSGEFKRFDKDGNPVWLNANYTPIATPDGEVYKVVKFARDITEEKVKSLEFEGQISAINNTMASIEFELDGTILKANDIFLEAMGYSLAEIKGKHHSMFVTKEYAESQDYKNFWISLGEGISQTGEFMRLRKDKTRIKLMANYTPILDDGDKPFKIIKFAQIISEAQAV